MSYLNVYLKKQNIISQNKLYLNHNKSNYFNSYVNKVEQKLFNLGYPYNLNAKKYLFVKFIGSFVLGLIAFINYKSIKALVIFYSVSFFIPNYLLYSFKNKEKYILINEIKNLTNSIILNLSAYSTLEQALTRSKVVLTYDRFINEYNKFIYEYKMNGYNLKIATNKLDKKFCSYELSLLLSTLIQGDAEGNLLNNMIKFAETLELNYFKYLKKKSSERLLYVTLGTVISLLNIVLVVMYPMFKQVLDNLQVMFS